MNNYRYPFITAADSQGKLQQIDSFLRQLVDQLNLAREQTVQAAASGQTGTVSGQKTGSTPTPATFEEVKALIIKSADVVTALYENFKKRFNGLYVAQSDFGVYAEQTESEIEANSTAIAQHYTDLQQIMTDVEAVEHTLVEVNANIKTGLLYEENGVPVYGLEIGQRTEVDGEEVFRKYARFTSEKLSFYDSNDNEVAYFSDKKLFVTKVEVTGSFAIGGFVDTVRYDKSVVTKWVAGGEG